VCRQAPSSESQQPATPSAQTAKQLTCPANVAVAVFVAAAMPRPTSHPIDPLSLAAATPLERCSALCRFIL
jgi:hypothetical protein